MQTSVDSFLHCYCCKCGVDLRWVETHTASIEEISAGNYIEHAIHLGWVAIGESVVYAPAFFLGATALVLAIHGRTKWQGLDMCRLEQRRTLISDACLLLPNWPQQLLQHGGNSHWTSVDFTVSRKQLPYWLGHIVAQNFVHRHSPISPDEAQAIYEHIEFKEGRFSLKAARTISGRMIERKHLILHQQSEVSDETFELLLAHIDHLISRSLNLKHRCHLFADKVMLALVRVCGLTQAGIANYTLTDATNFASQDPPDFWHVPTTQEGVSAWVGWYLRDVRPKLVSSTTACNAFVCRRDCSDLKESTFGERFRRHVKNACLQREIKNFSYLGKRSRNTPTLRSGQYALPEA